MTTYNRFDEKDPNESVVLTYDFSAGVPPNSGLALTNILRVTVATVFGTDSNPSAILAGGNQLDPVLPRAYIPVSGGLSVCDYDIVVEVATNNPKITYVLGAILPVRAQ